MILFDQYAKQRHALFGDDEETTSAATDEDLVQLAISRAQAVWRIHAYLEMDVVYPHIFGLDKEFPGIDPRGKYSRVEMRFAQRIDRLQMAAQLCPDPNKAILNQIFESACFSSLYERMEDYCKEIRICRDAAKLCPRRSASEKLEAYANYLEQKAVEKDLAVQEMDQILTLLEQVAGIKGGALNPNSIDACKRYVSDLPLTTEIPTGSRVQHTIPDSLELQVPDGAIVDAICIQERSADPDNLGDWDRLNASDPEEKREECVRRCVCAGTQNTLTLLFGACECMMGKRRTIDKSNRGTLVIVGDKTVSERMQERYIAERIKQPFVEWYHKNLDEMSAEFVFDALLAGEPVQAYIPGPDGKVRKQPIQLLIDVYRGGEVFDPRRKAQQDLGQEAAHVRLQANLKVMEASHLEPNGDFCTELFLESFFAKALQQWLVESDDSIVMSVCIGMLAKDHDIAEIMNPIQLQKERIAKVTEYANNYVAKQDASWLGEQIYYGYEALLNQIDQMMEGKDWSNPQVRNEMFPKIYPAVRALSHMYLYMNDHDDVKLAYFRAAEQVATKNGKNPGAGRTVANQMLLQAINVSALCKLMHRADTFRAMMSRPLTLRNEEAVDNGLTAQLAERCILQNYKWNPQQSFSGQCPFVNNLWDIEKQIQSMPEHEENVQRLVGGWKNWEKGANYILLEKITDGVKILGYDIDSKDKCSVILQYPTKLTQTLKEMTNPQPQWKFKTSISLGHL